MFSLSGRVSVSARPAAPGRRRAGTLTLLLATLLAVASAALLGAPAPAAGALAAPASAYSSGAPLAAFAITSGWEFLADPRGVGERQHWSSGSAGSGWQATTVPGVFDPRPSAAQYAGAVGWYRVTFTVPPEASGVGWALNFEQVLRSARVWLNGTELGSSSDPDAPFTLDAGTLTPGRPETLVVRVDNHRPAGDHATRWNWGGITRPVSAVPEGPVVAQNTGLMPEVTCSAPQRCTARVTYDAVLHNRSNAPASPRVAVTLTPPGSGPVTSQTATVPSLGIGQSLRVRFSFPVAGTPQLWSPDHPALYTAQLNTTVGTLSSQLDSLQIGMRSLTVRGGEIYLNGRAIRLRGAAIEEDAPGHGAALSGADMAAIVAQLRALHANVTRARHPLSQHLLSLLDQAGIMVWSQAPIYRRDQALQSSTGRDAALTTLASSLLQVRNHPSVITNSVADELTPTPDANAGVRAYLGAASFVSGDLDPTLPAAVDLAPTPVALAQSALRPFALLGVHSSFGWSPASPGLANLGVYLAALHHQYPAAALVLSQFGAEANHAGPSAQPGSFAFQSDYVSRVLQIADGLAFAPGAIYASLRDYTVRPRFYGDGGAGVDLPRDAYTHAGLAAYSGAAKPAYLSTAAHLASTPLYLLALRAAWWVSVVAVAILALIALVVAVDVRLFSDIRRDDHPPPGPQAGEGEVGGARERSQPPRTYA